MPQEIKKRYESKRGEGRFRKNRVDIFLSDEEYQELKELREKTGMVNREFLIEGVKAIIKKEKVKK